MTGGQGGLTLPNTGGLCSSLWGVRFHQRNGDKLTFDRILKSITLLVHQLYMTKGVVLYF